MWRGEFEVRKAHGGGLITSGFDRLRVYKEEWSEGNRIIWVK